MHTHRHPHRPHDATAHLLKWLHYNFCSPYA
jgi:hypothetical protein